MTIPCSVYMIYNDVDDAIYVGCTAKKLWQRMAKHQQNMNKQCCPLLHDRMKKYGPGRFNIKLLEFAECDTVKDRRKLEQKWIDLLKPELNSLKAYLSRDDRLKYMRDANNKKITCECGSIVRAGCLWNHQKTVKHIKFVADSKDSDSEC